MMMMMMWKWRPAWKSAKKETTDASYPVINTVQSPITFSHGLANYRRTKQ
jgi:hypothetical protein